MQKPALDPTVSPNRQGPAPVFPFHTGPWRQEALLQFLAPANKAPPPHHPYVDAGAESPSLSWQRAGSTGTGERGRQTREGAAGPRNTDNGTGAGASPAGRCRCLTAGVGGGGGLATAGELSPEPATPTATLMCFTPRNACLERGCVVRRKETPRSLQLRSNPAQSAPSATEPKCEYLAAWHCTI